MKIGIIGSGISGLCAAYRLSEHHEITLFERSERIGGHTHTHSVFDSAGQELAIDTGFIVCNDWTYPNFLTLMDGLGVKFRESTMSFGVKNQQNGLEYNGTSLATLFAQKRNVLSPRFLRMIAEILRFNREALADISKMADGMTLGEYLRAKNFSTYFQRNYILPMVSAIWSAGLKQAENFPFLTFANFFKNHGMLSVNERPQWKTVVGGSSSYIEPLTRNFRDRIRCGVKIRSVERLGEEVELHLEDDSRLKFDAIVFAVHSDQALALLKDPSVAEREILGQIPYSQNETVLHRDTSIMPRARAAWAGWNYFIPKEARATPILTYDMNALQGITSADRFLVTLNASDQLDPAKIIKTIIYHHPVYSPDSQRARARRSEISGVRRTHYCGAYWHYGFHEDGVKSAWEVCDEFGVKE
ncbi:MAG: FAD-dependent oxidoreductase [Bdellovibrionota bacterium]